MVQAKVNEGIVTLESTLKITDAQQKKIETHATQVNGWEKDFHCHHRLGEGDNKEVNSTLSRNILQAMFNPKDEVEDLEQAHVSFLAWIDTLEDPAKPDENAPADEDETGIFAFIVIPTWL